MSLSTVERILILLTALCVIYRTIADQWPVSVEVEE